MVDAADTSNKNASDGPVTSGSAVSSKIPRFSKKTILIGIVVVILVGILGFVGAHFYSNYREHKKQTDTITAITKRNATVKEAPVTDFSGTIQANINKETDPAKQAVLYAQLANEQVNHGKSADGLVSAQKAYGLVPSAGNAYIVGAIEETNKDYKAAVEWYQKAVDMSEKTAPSVNSIYNTYLAAKQSAEAHL